MNRWKLDDLGLYDTILGILPQVTFFQLVEMEDCSPNRRSFSGGTALVSLAQESVPAAGSCVSFCVCPRFDTYINP